MGRDMLCRTPGISRIFHPLPYEQWDVAKNFKQTHWSKFIKKKKTQQWAKCSELEGAELKWE